MPVFCNRNNYPRNIGFKFKEVEKEIDPSRGYYEKKELLGNNISEKLKEIRKEVLKLEERKSKVRSEKIKNLISDKEIKYPSSPNKQIQKQTQLIFIMLRNGYIQEDYLHYISYFYPGSISKRDHGFLMNVENELDTELDYKLDELGNVIQKLSVSDFGNPYILNYDLMDFILKKINLNTQKRNTVFNQLCDESSTSIVFIKGYLETGKYPEKFIKELGAKWSNIWSYITSSNEFNETEVSNVFKLILNNVELDNIKDFSSLKILILKLTEDSNALGYFNKEDRLIEVIESLDLKFSNLSFKGVSKEVKDFIYSNNHYVLNPYMIKLMMESFGTFDKEIFENKNYTAIKESNCSNLITYVKSKMTDYVKDVFLNLESNTQETLKSVLELLNNPDIPTYSKEDIIQQSITKIDSFSKLDAPSELMNFLLDTSNVKASWENIMYVFEKSEAKFSESLNRFLNYEENCDELSNEKILGKEDAIRNFSIAFLNNNTIKDDLYEKYLNAFIYKYDNLLFELLSPDKGESLVEGNKLSFNLNNYNGLKKNFQALHLDFILRNLQQFLHDNEEIEFNTEEKLYLIRKSRNNDREQTLLIEHLNDYYTLDDIEILTDIGFFSLKNDVQLSVENLKKILLNSTLSANEKIQIYLKHIDVWDNDFLTRFLTKLGGDFARLNKRGPRPRFKYSSILEAFFEYLESSKKISKATIKGDSIHVSTFRK